MYYYLLSSVSSLNADTIPGLSAKEFLEIAEPWLSPNDKAILYALDANEYEKALGSPLITAFSAFEVGLRNTLVRARASKLGKDPVDFLRLSKDGSEILSDVQSSEAARLALQAETPLEGENLLDRIRWNYLESLEAGHWFDSENLIAYYLKLTILDKKRRRTVESGTKQYIAAYEKVATTFSLDPEL